MDLNVRKDTVVNLYREKEESYVEKQEQIARRILGDKHDLVYDFFCDVLDMEAEYKVLRARRCQVLFGIYLPIILAKEEDIQVCGNFISDHALEQHKSEIRKGSCVIVDDIVIYGRGLQGIYKDLMAFEGNGDIFIKVIVRSRKANLPQEIIHKMEYCPDVDDWQWRSMSSQFVDLIAATSHAYISYVGSYHETGSRFKIDEYKSEFDIIQNEEFFCDKHHASSVLLFEKENKLSFFEQIGYDCCLRVYMGEKADRNTYVPYVFVKNLSRNAMKDILGNVCAYIKSEEITYIKNALLTESESDKGLEYQMKLFSALINQVYAVYLKNKYDSLYKNAVFDTLHLELCFGEEITKELSGLTYQGVESLLLDYMCDDVDSGLDEKDEELRERLDKLVQNIEVEKEQEWKQCIQKYFYENGKIDDQEARSDRERRDGLTMQDFYGLLNRNNVHFMSASQLLCWDSGIASCNIKKKGQCIASFARAGEQSFRYVLEKYKDIIRDMIEDYSAPLWQDAYGDKTGPEIAMERFNCYIKSDKAKNDKDINMLKCFIRDNKDTLEDWGIMEILA